MKNTISFASFLAAAMAQSTSLPDLIKSQPDLSILGEAIGMVPDLAKTLGGLKDVTLLAPTDSAFKTLLNMDENLENTAIKQKNVEAIAALLSYHVLNGTFTSGDFSGIPTYVHSLFTQASKAQGLSLTNVTNGQNVGLVLNDKNATILSGELQSANVVQADIKDVEGYTIHKIDEVLVLPRSLSETLASFPQVGLTSALGALVATDLVDTVDTVEDLTIFIPNNDAFVGAASAFANASEETLASVLKYHAVTGATVFASDIKNGTTKTLNGNELRLSVGTDGTVYVNNAKVVLPNIILSNGVAHIIDTVLNPEEKVESPSPASTPVPAFSGASPVGGTEVPFTSAIAGGHYNASSLSIPAIATTAKFVSPGGANASKTEGGSGSPTGTPTPSEPAQGGAAFKVSGAIGAAVLGLGAALML